MAATDETTGVNAAEERAERAERREVLLIDWMEGEIWILKWGGKTMLIAGEETEGRRRRRKKKEGKEEEGRRQEWAGLMREDCSGVGRTGLKKKNEK